MTTGAGPTPTERVLRLAAFAGDRCVDGAEITLTDIVDGVGYSPRCERNERDEIVTGTKDWESVRKAVTRDVQDLRTAWGIRLELQGGALDVTEPKTFRVDRMRDVRLGDDAFDPPPDAEIPDWFDLSVHERGSRCGCGVSNSTRCRAPRAW